MCQMEMQKKMNKNREESIKTQDTRNLGDRTGVMRGEERSGRLPSQDPILRIFSQRGRSFIHPNTISLKQSHDIKQLDDWDEDDWEDDDREEAWRRVFNENETIEHLRATKQARLHRREAEACARAAAAHRDCFAPQWVGDVQLQFFIEL